MRTIITGGTGLIGKALVEFLVEAGHEVIILSRNPANYDPKDYSDARLVGWDARSAAGWGHLADGAHAIVNLAGESLAGKGLLPNRWTPAKKEKIWNSRVQAGEAVVEAVTAAETKPNVVIQASAVGYYGPQGDEMITEAHPAADDFLARVCIAWEGSTKPVEDVGVRRVVLRISGIVLDKDDGALFWLRMPHIFFVGGPLGSGNQWYSWIHPEDEARAIAFLIDEKAASGPFNVAAPNPERNKDFEKIIGKVLNRPSWMPVPGFAMKLAFGEVSTVVLTGQRVIPKKLEEMGFEFKYPGLEAALKDKLIRSS